MEEETIFFELSGLLYSQGWRASDKGTLVNPSKTSIELLLLMEKDSGPSSVQVSFLEGANFSWPSLKLDEFEEIENAIRLIDHTASFYPQKTTPQ